VDVLARILRVKSIFRPPDRACIPLPIPQISPRGALQSTCIGVWSTLSRFDSTKSCRPPVPMDLRSCLCYVVPSNGLCNAIDQKFHLTFTHAPHSTVPTRSTQLTRTHLRIRSRIGALPVANAPIAIPNPPPIRCTGPTRRIRYVWRTPAKNPGPIKAIAYPIPSPKPASSQPTDQTSTGPSAYLPRTPPKTKSTPM